MTFVDEQPIAPGAATGGLPDALNWYGQQLLAATTSLVVTSADVALTTSATVVSGPDFRDSATECSPRGVPFAFSERSQVRPFVQ